MMMRRALTLATYLFFLAMPAHAARLKLHPYGAVDIFLPTNAGKGLEEDTRLAAAQLSSIGYSSAYTVETRAAVGIRGGVKGNISEKFELGGSLGYIVGPNSDVDIVVTAPGLSGILKNERQVRFVRYLLEPAFLAPINENVTFHIGGGIGLASAHVEDTITCTGNACVRSGSSSTGKSDWSGFTWEFSPYLSFKYATLGMRYAGFPKSNGDADNSKMNWSSVALFAGLQF